MIYRFVPNLKVRDAGVGHDSYVDTVVHNQIVRGPAQGAAADAFGS
jgi:hypothetical protein